MNDIHTSETDVSDFISMHTMPGESFNSRVFTAVDHQRTGSVSSIDEVLVLNKSWAGLE